MAGAQGAVAGAALLVCGTDPVIRLAAPPERGIAVFVEAAFLVHRARQAIWGAGGALVVQAVLAAAVGSSLTGQVNARAGRPAHVGGAVPTAALGVHAASEVVGFAARVTCWIAVLHQAAFVVDRARLPEDCARSAGASVAVLGAAI